MSVQQRQTSNLMQCRIPLDQYLQFLNLRHSFSITFDVRKRNQESFSTDSRYETPSVFCHISSTQAKAKTDDTENDINKTPEAGIIAHVQSDVHIATVEIDNTGSYNRPDSTWVKGKDITTNALIKLSECIVIVAPYIYIDPALRASFKIPD